MKQFILLIVVFVSVCATANAQMNVGSNQAPDSSAMLQISGNTKGFLPPRMTRDTMLLIRNPAKGLIVFNTTDSALFMRRDTGWVKLLGNGTVTSASVVSANGLAGTVANAGSAPAITLSTTVSGMVKGNGSALSAANSGTDYSPGTAANTTGIVKSTNGTGALTTATASDFPALNQNTTGTASNITGVLNAASHPALTGDVTTPSGSVATTISNSAVTNAKMATMPSNTFKANNTGATAAPTDITATQATAMLNTFTSATKGLVPQSGGGTTTFLRADGTFAAPAGSATGSVTSVSVTTANGVSGTVTNNTTTPAISLTLGDITPTSVKTSGDIISGGSVWVDRAAANTGSKTPGLLFGDLASGESISSKRTGDATNGGFGLNFYTNSQNRMSISQTGNIGIGNISPAYKLHVTATSNPLYLAGVNTGTSTSADSILTITSGVVKKLPMSTFATPGNSWSITGNSGTIVDSNFLGTTDNKSLTFRTNNTQRVLIGNSGNVAIGTTPAFSLYPEKLLVDAGTTSSYNVISGKGSINNYLQLNIQNKNDGGSASSDVVATADNGDEGNNYIDMGINSSANSSNYFGGANDAYLYTQGQNLLIGTAANSKSVVFLTGGGTQSSNERMRIDGTGNVGIGISAPTARLHVAGTNPLTLNGVQTGTSTSADSLLTITSGVVKKIPISTFTSANSWSLTGNSGTASGSNFLGTSDNQSLKFRTNNLQRMTLDSLGNVIIGSDATIDGTNPEKFLINAGTTNSVNGLVAKGSINNYFQMNIKNNSSGANATSDIVATANNGTETSNYVDLGINGSGYNGGTIETGVANDGYLISAGNDFYMVNSSANKSMLFLTGGTGVANERMRILANGRVGMGVQDPKAPFVVKDTMEVRRVGNLSQLLFTNTAGTGDFRIGGDGGDIFWQGGGGRALQMGSYWTTVLSGDRQTSNYPSFVSGLTGTGILVPAQRDGSVALGVQANSASQSANLTEWRNSSATALTVINKDGDVGIGVTSPTADLHLRGGTTAANSAPLKFTSGTNMTTPEAGAVEFDGFNYFATSGTTRYTLAKTLTSTASLDFPSTVTNAVSTLNITVTGATDGDAVSLGAPNSVMSGNSSFVAYVSSANTVTVKFMNNSGNAIDPPQAVFRVSVLKY